MKFIDRLLIAMLGGGEIVLWRARVYCRRELPPSWTPVPSTVFRAGVSL